MAHSYMSYVKNFLVLATCAGLQACSTPPPAPAPSKVDPASVLLDQALAEKPGVKSIGPESAAPAPQYGAKTSVSFLGDASILLANAAKGRGTDWTFKVTGPQPRLPIYVQISVKDVTFNDFLKDVAEQLGQRADIAVNGKSIELRYRAQN